MNNSVVSMYNLDGSLLPQKNLLRAYPHDFIDCYDIRGKNLYCEPQALHDIHAQILSSPQSPIALIGSGNFHYVTYLHLLQIQQPFTLLLFDHHTDLMENKHLLTCGSWVAKALRDIPHMKKAIIVGPNPKELDRIPLDLQDRVTIFPDDWDSEKLINHIEYECETEEVYISIDKDVLDESFSKTNWDHGQMDLTVLLDCLTYLMKASKVQRIDICGEWLVSPENSYTPKNQVFIKRNERANLAILQVLVKNQPALSNYKISTPSCPNISASVESGRPTTVK